MKQRFWIAFAVSSVVFAVAIGSFWFQTPREKAEGAVERSDEKIQEKTALLVKDIRSVAHYIPSKRGTGVGFDEKIKPLRKNMILLGSAAVPKLLELLRSQDAKTRLAASYGLKLITGLGKTVMLETAQDDRRWNRIIVQMYDSWWRENRQRTRVEWLLTAIRAKKGEIKYDPVIGLLAFGFLLEAHDKVAPERIKGMVTDGCGNSAVRSLLSDATGRERVIEEVKAAVKQLGIEKL